MASAIFSGIAPGPNIARLILLQLLEQLLTGLQVTNLAIDSQGLDYQCAGITGLDFLEQSIVQSPARSAFKEKYVSLGAVQR
jgi:hypothetical protein